MRRVLAYLSGILTAALVPAAWIAIATAVVAGSLLLARLAP